VFRPCIDLHDGKVKQIVGGSLNDDNSRLTETNFVSEQDSAWFASLYQQDGLTGGHVIKLGPGNDEAAARALQAYPGGLQIGGGVTDSNARLHLELGASHVIITSYVFHNGSIDLDRLGKVVKAVGREKLVLDLSCRKRDGVYWVVTDRWQNFTDVRLSRETFEGLSGACAEFLVHAVDVEGLCRGIDRELVESLAGWCPIPVTYAGGARPLDDLHVVNELSGGKVDLTIGSAMDIFGGNGVRYQEAVAHNRNTENARK
jgi:phosphoribosylformimino-5-aminoimidazole carboxamide ribotide isomerase